MDCAVAAPSLTPRKPGDRIKTNRRDARKLAELHRAGMLTTIIVPERRQESIRDLLRARDDARKNVMSARHRLGKFLLRHGLGYPDARTGGTKPRQWNRALRIGGPVGARGMQEYIHAVESQK